MKTNLRVVTGIIISFWLSQLTAKAQDLVSLPVFSQFQYTPHLTNPAMIGSMNDMQFTFNYRRKQVVSGETFDTPMFSFSTPFTSKKTGKRWGALGASVMSDNAAGFLRTNGAMLAFAYNFYLGEKWGILSAGLQGGYFQRRLDYTGQSTSSQYDGVLLNPNLGNGENFSSDGKNFFTVGGGLNWSLQDEKKREKAFLGVSYLNFNQPSVDILNATGAKLPAALQATAGYRIIQTERFSMMPNLRYLNSGNNTQINAGSWFRYHFLGTPDTRVIREGSLGLGAWYDTNNSGVVALELNQPNYLLVLSYDIPTSKDISNVQRAGVFEITAALKLNRAKPITPESDKDGDGVLDQYDNCPDVPGLKEFSGCPDTDGDGVPDSIDACINDKGDKKLMGCPDTDGDGIADKDDACPTEAGTIATKGCPDKDGDTVIDSEDQCPDQPGLKEDKGCPKPVEKATISQKEKMELDILENAKYVHFRTGTSIIEETSHGMLDLVAEVMKFHPTDVLNLEGHTDAQGLPEKNMKLSQERAEAVKVYLVTKGVNASNITTIGKGQTEPVSDNNTEKGRSLNRRVEMKILKKK
jgi:type IX secretion system PorP/SprF family membrane protein